MTRWAKDVSPGNVLPDYPRPQMVRNEWLNLNGLWEYAIAADGQGPPDRFDGRILVPFAVESALSGVGQALLPAQRLWYRRTFDLPSAWRGLKTLLHFGAVDYEATVWVNGHPVGTHCGGYTPFSFDITNQVHEGTENEILVSVWDPTDTGDQERGKQVLRPNTIWYTAVSGIWQTVWLEPVPEVHICGLQMNPDVDRGLLSLQVRVEGAGARFQLQVEAFAGAEPVAAACGPVAQGLVLSIPRPNLWSPESPHLYELTITLVCGDQVLDRVESYFGMRKFGLEKDEAGIWRLFLNNRPCFHYGPLDQGYWPDGLYTAPTDEALRFDVELCKKLGFNTIRKHVKVEPARWYYHCDRLGIVVWQDMPNGGKAIGGLTALLALNQKLNLHDTRGLRRFGRARPASREQYQLELEAMIESLRDTPCIGMWILFNEGWGQFDAAPIARWVQACDPTRPVDHASGWFDQGGGDVASTHIYFKSLKLPAASRRRAALISEFGGYSLECEGHVWQPGKHFGYRALPTSDELTAAYVHLLRNELKPLIRQGLSGAVYTQWTDVEIELNGYLTYDRALLKMDLDQIAPLHRQLDGLLPPGA